MIRRWIKEVIGDFTVEKRGSSPLRYNVFKNGEFVMSFTTLGRARAYAVAHSSKQPNPTPFMRRLVKDMNETERNEHEVAKIERRRARKKAIAEALIEHREAWEENDSRERVARGLPADRKHIEGKMNVGQYMSVMRAKHGPDWKPSTLGVFDDELREDKKTPPEGGVE